MGKKVSGKFVWVIKDFSSLQSEKIYSDPFVIGGCKWQLLAYPKGNDVDYLSLYLEDLADCASLPCGWRRKSFFRLTVVNQFSKKLSVREETEHWFDGIPPCHWGFASMIPLTGLHAEDGGFLVNGDLMVVAKVNVLKVIGGLDESEESDDASEDGVDDDDDDDSSEEDLDYDDEYLSEEHYFDKQSPAFAWCYSTPLEILAEDDVFEESIPLRKFNGFLLLPSQVGSVRRIFERHPDIAVEFRAKNKHLRTTFMNFLLSLIETLYQPLQELSNEDLVEADIALTYLKDVGFKVDWLEKKLDQLKEKKEKELSCEARVREMEAQLHDLKQKLETEKAELSATRAPISLDDIV